MSCQDGVFGYAVSLTCLTSLADLEGVPWVPWNPPIEGLPSRIRESVDSLCRGGCLFTQSHADHVIGLYRTKGHHNLMNSAKSLAKGRRCVFPLTGKIAL